MSVLVEDFLMQLLYFVDADTKLRLHEVIKHQFILLEFGCVVLMD